MLQTPKGCQVNLGSSARGMINKTASGAISLYLLCNTPHVNGMNDVIVFFINALSLTYIKVTSEYNIRHHNKL